MKADEVRTELYRERVCVVLREKSPEAALAKARALREGGLRALEVTCTTPGAAAAIAELAKQGIGLPGAGSVVRLEQAKEAVAAGARFLVSPVHVRDVSAWAREQGVVYLAGALTPQEALDAWEAGSRPVKIFPVCDLGGAAYVRHLLAPLPFLELCPTGGITPENFRTYLDAGAKMVGMGEALTNAPGSLSELAAKVRAAAGAV
jgi:2-dehydro-3-deoxyphosphogluconate aldolase/(4S)-4-hydroxy-2-oxoglutarate aldolase